MAPGFRREGFNPLEKGENDPASGKKQRLSSIEFQASCIRHRVSSQTRGGEFMSAPFEPGMSRELTIVSTADDSARKFYPNLPDVFGTPCLGGLMERVWRSL